ncbi:MAG: L-histidine N(alpha)-methyltransferase [Dokdonella sp.]
MTVVRSLHPAATIGHADDFAADVRKGLSTQPKRMGSKYFYDAIGSALFERICDQPEYYLTRTELQILGAHVEAIADVIGPRALLVEYGSGAGIKTRLLLAALDRPVGYVPIEISDSALDASIDALADEFPDVQMLPVCADFTRTVKLPLARQKHERVVVFFPGSTLGNFEQRDAVSLLRTMRDEIGANGFALVGVDLKKDRATLEAAYNDAAGVTRDFTLNLLARMNRELDGDFDLSQFRHRAHYNALAGRIETHIVSVCAQSVAVAGRRFGFAKDEAMLVEYSCKYAQADIDAMAAKAGLRVVRTWTDAEQRFALQLLERA